MLFCTFCGHCVCMRSWISSVVQKCLFNAFHLQPNILTACWMALYLQSLMPLLQLFRMWLCCFISMWNYCTTQRLMMQNLPIYWECLRRLWRSRSTAIASYRTSMKTQDRLYDCCLREWQFLLVVAAIFHAYFGCCERCQNTLHDDLLMTKFKRRLLSGNCKTASIINVIEKQHQQTLWFHITCFT